MGESVYWVWLQQILGYGNRNTEQVVELCGHPKDLYRSSVNAKKECIFLTRKQREIALDDATMECAEMICRRCNDLGIKLLTPDDDLYPERLYDICDYPTVLYYKGEMPDVDDNVILTIVGTRKASADGRMIAAALAQGLSQCGAIIMSGGARGIDDAAHQGALRVGGTTVSILGCGLDVDYNSQCEETRKRILETGGALISEFPPGSNPTRQSFPIRNRLLSAMSLGVIVGEAPAKSGALITARHALDMGRDMFAIPGSVMSELSEAANMLIRDGAKPVSCAFDVLEEYNAKFPHRLSMRGSQKPILEIARSAPEFVDINLANGYAYLRDNSVQAARDRMDEKLKTVRGTPVPLPENASETATRLYALLTDYALNLDEICKRLYIPASKLLTAITELEIEGVLSSDSQRKYYINKQ